MIRKVLTVSLLFIMVGISSQLGAQTRTVAAIALDLYYGPDLLGCGPTTPSPFGQVSSSWRTCLEDNLRAFIIANDPECGPVAAPHVHIENLTPLSGFPPILFTPDGPAAIQFDLIIDPFSAEPCGSEGSVQTGIPLPGSLRSVVCPDGSAPNGFECTIDLAQNEDKEKSKGEDPCNETGGISGGAWAGNPCNVANGNKFEAQQDYAGAGSFPVTLVRFHNSQQPSADQGGFGPTWTHSYSASIQVFQGSTSLYTARVSRRDGKVLYFSASLPEGPWISDGDTAHTLTQITQAGAQKWRLTLSAGEIAEVYDVQTGQLESIGNRAGLTQTLTYGPDLRLQSVADPFGRTLTFAYDANGRISTVTNPAQDQITYTYDAQNGNLLSVTYPGSPTAIRSYQYGDTSFPRALTAIVNELSTTFATWTYDANGRAISSSHAGGAGLVTMTYPGATATEVTSNVDTGVSATRTYNFELSWGIKRLASITGPVCPSCGPQSQTYDTNGNVASQIDWNGNRTNYTYDLARNLQTSRIEGLSANGDGTPHTRTISTEWHETFRLPTRIAEPLRLTTNVYDLDGAQCGARGARCSTTIQATTDASGTQGFSAAVTGLPRTWTHTYNNNGDVLTVDGPRTNAADVTRFTYYPNDDADLGKRGNLSSVTNAAGHVTSFAAYNTHGQPTTIVDPNGLTTTLAYDARQRLTSRTAGGETTTYDYDAAGQLIKVTLPDGSFLSYTYDGAQRLIGIQDSLGNRISYALDAMGNRTLEEVRDPSSNLAQTRSRVYSSLNRLFQELGAQSQTTEYTYDNQGNVLSVKDPLNRITLNQYDPLNRLAQVTDPALGVTQYAYNGLDALTQVTDPRSLVTGYTVDGLANLTQQAS
ncbi:MAG: DUF6531 domain-containing protein, partial [Betaproteobacteria bacterium]